MNSIENGPIGVIGSGPFASSLVAMFLGAGFRVFAFAADEKVRNEALQQIEHALSDMVAHGVTAHHTSATWRERYTQASSLSELAPSAFVLDTLFGDLDTKRLMYDELEAVLPANVPIATNTSALTVTSIQNGRKNPDRFLAMHWAPPAYATRFLEIVRGERTSDEVVALATQLAQSVDKEPSLISRDVPGFVVNRLCYAMYREAAHMLEEGIADAETIDTSFRNACGLWATFCGPLRWIDFTGGPALYAEVMRAILPTLSSRTDIPNIFAQKERDNERGTTNGIGFYTYEPHDTSWQERYEKHVWEVRRLQNEYFPL